MIFYSTGYAILSAGPYFRLRMNVESPLVSQNYLLEKFPGKGGWTYARIPEILQRKDTPFGWVRVKGSIDGVEISAYHLMPMGNGQLFLPVKASIRKIIKKEAGDWVQVILFEDLEPVNIPEDILQCLRDESGALTAFSQLNPGEQKHQIDHIQSAKSEEIKVNRIVELLRKLSEGQFG